MIIIRDERLFALDDYLHQSTVCDLDRAGQCELLEMV